MTNPVLTGGEKYSELVNKRLGGNNTAPEITFAQAKTRLVQQIRETKNQIVSMPTRYRLPSEFVVCIRMNPKYSAKSYFPSSLIRTASGEGMNPVGSRSWYPQVDTPAKLIFTRTTEQGLSNLENYLQSEDKTLSEQLTLDVRRIEKLDLLSNEEKLEGFQDSWQEGYVEFVFHPFLQDKNLVVKTFQENTGLENLEIRQYDSGIIFALAKTNKESLEQIKEYNPLRSAHPLNVEIDPFLRTYSSNSGPKPPTITQKNKIAVGVIDGGINTNHVYFKNVTSNEDHTTAPVVESRLKHGTSVTGMLLYGNFDQYGPDDQLPEPDFFVKSFRVFPQGSTTHTNSEKNELYDVIDEIEKIIPANPDVRIWNLSFGPKGPIYDDYITRFTYVCDKLTREHDIQFCVAVGNDGKESNPRIQSPSDAVNVVSVGAFTYEDGKPVKADYSCTGPGREGNKFKPDISALGGSERYLLHYASPQDGIRDVGIGGTSLATPQVTAMLARLVGQYSLDPLSARSLLLNKTCLNHAFDIQFGHGILQDKIEPFTTCKDGSITIQYRGRLLPGKFAQLQIPWPEITLHGKVIFIWTLTVLGQTNELYTDEYTRQSMELTFYPNDSKYTFTSPNKKRRSTLDTQTQLNSVRRLLSEGWTKSQFPKSACGPQLSIGEQNLRATDMKWDNVIQGRKPIQSASHVQNPFFHLHCFSREENILPTDYSLTLTIQLQHSNQDIYTPIVGRYPALVPLTETIQQKISVQATT